MKHFLFSFFALIFVGHSAAQGVKVSSESFPIEPDVVALPVLDSSAKKVTQVEVQQPVAKTWTMEQDKTITTNLKVWAEQAKWKLIWSAPKDWMVPANTSFTGEFPDAVESVVKTLASNGALIRAQIYDGNKTIVITGPGVSE